MADLIDNYKNCSTEIDGKWVISRPLEFQGIYKYWLRAKDALMVLRGKAVAVTFYNLPRRH